MPVCSIDSDKERERESKGKYKTSKSQPRITQSDKLLRAKKLKNLCSQTTSPCGDLSCSAGLIYYFFLLCISSNVFRRYLCLSGAFSWLELLVWTRVRLNSKNSWCESCILGCWANSLNAILPSLRRWIVAGYFMLLHAFAIEFHF